jgi:hypothetical protein
MLNHPPQPRGFDPDDGILLGIEITIASERLDGNGVALQVSAFTA